MRKLRDIDYLLEITVRVAVHKEDAAAVIAANQNQNQDNEEEGDRVLTAILDRVEGGVLDQASHLLYVGSCAWRIPTVKEFEDIRTLGELSQRTRRPETPPSDLRSPLATKRNKGRKLSLDTADRLFAGLQERINRLPDYEEFGVAVPLILLFGSYLRREPEVGDIDLAIMTLPKANYKMRREELSKARKSGISFFEALISPKTEVLQFLKNRSGWLALHDFSECLSMKQLSFQVVHCISEFQPSVDRLQRGELTSQQFLTDVEELRAKLHARANVKL